MVQKAASPALGRQPRHATAANKHTQPTHAAAAEAATMIVSLVVVVLVGIGFTRLTMLALELRDNFDEDEPLDVGRKRVDCHNRMRAMTKPATLVFRNDNQFETEGVPRFEPGLVTRTINSILCPRDDADKDDDVEKGITVKEVVTDDSDCDNLLDPTEACTICFEKAKNAVIIGCGHGGLCYNCSIDICVTSGMCPFCRADIGQVVTIGLGRYEVDDDGRKVVPVIGPK